MKTIATLSLVILLSVLTTGGLYCQSQDTSFNGLDALIGKWEGSGWMRLPDGTRVEFNQTEDIYPKLDGKLIVVNGLGRDKVTNEKVFEAFGIISYDKEKEKYIFTTYTDKGNHGVADVFLEDGKLDWWFKVANGGTIKYTITYTDTTWNEDGNYSPDGENWHPFFHMDLTKVAKE